MSIEPPIQGVTPILIVEDEVASLELLGTYFSNEPFLVFKAASCAEARDILQKETISVVLLDINLPDGDGLELTKEIRKKSDLGIILVTQKKSDIDRILGLELGADDYVTKPYNIRELLVRVKNLVHRLQPRSTSSEEGSVNSNQAMLLSTPAPLLAFGEWRLDQGRRRLVRDDETITQLTEGEFKLLLALVQNAGQVLDRDQIMNRIDRKDWNPLDRTIDVLIARLRRKLGDSRVNPRYINTAHGTGYVFIEMVTSTN